jgi:hypothetical protein
MDTGWIQVFVLTLAECVAPAGKTACQESQFELQFLTQTDCEFALEQLLELKSNAENVIVDQQRSGCATTAREREVFSSLNAATNALSDQNGWRAPDVDTSEPSRAALSHKERLASLQTCEQTGGLAPCKIGEIIIEGAAEQVDVWQRVQ